MTSIEALINRQILKWETEKKLTSEAVSKPERPAMPIVTISRQSGSRGSYFGSRLAQRLGYQRLHRDAIDAICSSSGYVKRIVESLDDHHRSELALLVEGFFSGQMVDHADYFRHLYHVVLSMSHLGGVVLMGRGGNFILGPRHGFHLRIVCPIEHRVENLIKFRNLSPKDAREQIEHSDHERRQFVSRLFKADIDDPLQYDLVINTSLMDVEDLVEMAALALKAKMNKLAHLEND
ncbi:MAG: cytidylate kinase-like family protein [candidate division Zixibacteria bacterium]|nr:cytidylate kinase-like family protein [candidate division Zixibacteria bacterium]